MARPLTHPEIDRLLLHLIAGSEPNVARRAAQQFGLSRQAVNKHLRELVDSGAVVAKGSTRARRYELVKVEEHQAFPLAGLEEHSVWDEFVQPYLSTLPDNVRSICQYGVTEMVNNAIDHSGGTKVGLVLEMDAVSVQIIVYDDGVGIFRKIKEAFHLERESEAILELSKGKLTTDPSRHSGEGIFFTSRVFDVYSIYSGNLFFNHVPDNDDWLLEHGHAIPGTAVAMRIDPVSSRTLSEVFDQFATPDQYRFDITHVPVKLAQLGEDSLVSRSQAKRLVARFEKFSRVILNFAGVATIGQAFADEVFRVFRNAHPEVDLRWVNASDEVERMIRRAGAGVIA
jgi:anti-sigma regulatory factor (Ser/Thr protein kinase)/biotin operon repressor